MCRTRPILCGVKKMEQENEIRKRFQEEEEAEKAEIKK